MPRPVRRGQGGRRRAALPPSHIPQPGRLRQLYRLMTEKLGDGAQAARKVAASGRVRRRRLPNDPFMLDLALRKV